MTTQLAIRCAIYTRKSSEEGLEQAFNSLDAQYEACAAYVASQKHEGWKLASERYDDGGLSGGNLERPALKRLLADIDAGRIGMVVVYKIDRLTRALTDFAKLVDRFDAAHCSFVSVTQAFNTSSSMGRLTLNVLLSFAQFEREVTAERIRDKIAASKKKGLWMGGMVPLGYDCDPDPKVRGLVINVGEAEIVKTLFELYDQLGSLKLVEREAVKLGLRSKRHVFSSGKTRGGAVMTRGMIHHLLTNPIYRGQIRHKKAIWPGQQARIIPDELWHQVQEKLQDASARKRGGGGAESDPTNVASALTGKLRDASGDRLTPTHTQRHGRRLRYYVSSRLLTGKASPKAEAEDGNSWRLPAPAFESVIAEITADHLEAAAASHLFLIEPDIQSAARLASAAAGIAARLRSDDKATLRSCIASVQLGEKSARIELVAKFMAQEFHVAGDAIAPSLLSITAAFELRRRGVEVKILAGNCTRPPDPTLRKALAKAHQWAGDLAYGTPLSAIAQREGCSEAYLRTRAPLAFLAPVIQTAILAGTQPPELSVAHIMRLDMPLDWPGQMKVLGFSR